MKKTMSLRRQRKLVKDQNVIDPRLDKHCQAVIEENNFLGEGCTISKGRVSTSIRENLIQEQFTILIAQQNSILERQNEMSEKLSLMNLELEYTKKYIQKIKVKLEELREKDNFPDLIEKLTTDFKPTNTEILERIKLIENNGLKAVTEFFSKKQTEQEIERTISYKLGKELMESRKSVKSLISLPATLLSLRRELIERNTRRSEKMLKPLQNDLISPVSSTFVSNNQLFKGNMYFELDQILEQSLKINNFNGFLFDYLGLRDHPLLVIKQTVEELVVQSTQVINDPRYFQSEKIISRSTMLPFLFNDKFIEFSSDVLIDGLGIEFIISLLDKNKNRVNFKLIRPNVKVKLDIGSEIEFIKFGVKLIGNNRVTIKDVRVLPTVSPMRSLNQPSTEQTGLTKGVSIIIPSYKGEKTILAMLESIGHQQKINFKEVEVICILNGDLDNSPQIIKKFSKQKPHLTIKTIYSAKASAAAARNLGIVYASREYITFLDDDDLLTSNYIHNLYKHAAENTMVLSYIYDLSLEGLINKENNINKQLKLNFAKPNFNNCSSAITMMASKLIPTNHAKSIKFNEGLKSGEDVAYFSEYIDKFKPEIKVVEDENSAYIRRLTPNSLSRQPLNFDFNVDQRLDVIKALEDKSLVVSNRISPFVKSKIRSQVTFITKYLEAYPNKLERVLEAIICRKIIFFPYSFFWEKLGKKEAEQVVFSYCHPPFVDTSAVIVGKRVNQFGLLSDIIANDMANARGIDEETALLNRHYINNSFFLKTPTSFGNWQAIKEFAIRANAVIEHKSYKQIYSRALWPASHFAAAIYKLKHPSVKWVAEFSDPVVLDIKGESRFSKLEDRDWIEDIITNSVSGSYSFLRDEDNVYVWCELLVFLFADEIIFTCENQRQLMLKSFKYNDISQQAHYKSKIMAHPTLPAYFYNLGKSEYFIDNEFFNMAYFGNFYINRRFDKFLEAIEEVNNEKNTGWKKIKLHVFTNSIESIKEDISKYNKSISDFVSINEYVSFFDFLELTKRFDCLIVNDSMVSDIFGINPYLPSKLSDYTGSALPIFSLVEKGSAMDLDKRINFKAYLDSKESIKVMLSSALIKIGNSKITL